MSALLLANQVYNTTWLFVESQNFYPASINIPMLMIGGWYDHNTELMLEFFNALRASSPIAVRDQHRLLMGPWAHGGSGAAYVGTAMQGQLSYPQAAGWNDSLALLFFDYHLRGISNGWNSTAYVQYFQMGENTWTTSGTWPPTGMNAIKLYLQNNNLLTSGIPSFSSGSSSYNYDPRDPSPTIGGATLRPDLDQGPYDQAPMVESRNDLAFFESPVIGQNVVMKGNAKVHLFVSTDRLDTDFTVRLTDVYPDGRSMILCDGIKRLRFRDGYYAADTSVAVPGQVYEIEISLPTVAHTFLAGHKIRIDITSSNYPRYDSNLNNGGAMYVSGDTLIASNTVYHNANQASYIELNLVDFIGEIPESGNEILDIFPNPSSGTIFITQWEKFSGCEWQMTDLNGKVTEAGTLNSSFIKFNASTGIYFFRITNQDKTYFTKLILY